MFIFSPKAYLLALTANFCLAAMTASAALMLNDEEPLTLTFDTFTAPDPWSNDGGTNGALEWSTWAFSTGTRTAVAAVFGASEGTGHGISTGGTGDRGIHAFEVATNVWGWGLQATGSFGSPGSLTLRVRNNTGEVLRNLSVAYTAWYFNDAPREGVLRPYYSLTNDGTADSYLQADDSNQDIDSPAVPDATPFWVSNDRGYTLTGLSVADGEDIYLRWGFNDSGSGTRDEWAITSITLGMTMEPGPVVINEVMYHAAEDPDEPYDYVELFNRSGDPVDLTGWVLRGVGTYELPDSTVLNPGAYLVVAADPDTLIAQYGLATNLVLGPWSGRLQNSGELLRLVDSSGTVMDWVEYSDEEPWPVAADGLGPSLERLSADSFGGTPANWQSSVAETNWVQASWTQTVSGTDHDLRIWADYDGLIWLDDVSVQKVGDPTNLVVNGDFEAGETGWAAIGNHERSRTEPDTGRSGRGYGIAAKFTRIVDVGAAFTFQGDSVTNHIRSDAMITEDGEDYEISAWIRRGGLGGMVHIEFAGTQQTISLSHDGTPGAANSRSLPALGPSIQDVTHEADIVGVNTQNLITARVTGDPDLVEVRYRTVSSNTYTFTAMDYATATMTNDGQGNYSASIPGVATNRSAVLYHIRARDDSLAYEIRSPRADDPSRDWGYWVESDPLQTVVPNWHILVDGGPIVYSNALYACAVSPEGQVFPHAIVRHRGRPSSSPSGAQRTGFALRMNQNRDYDAYFAPGQDGINFRHRGDVFENQHQRNVNEYLAYQLQRRLGLITPHTRHVCIWLDGVPTITAELESPRGDFLANHGLSSDDYISRAGYTGRNRVDGDETLDNFDATIWLLDNATGDDRTGLVHSNLWLETMMFTTAINTLGANGDQSARWNMFQHRRADNGLWTFYAWDTDLTFQPFTNTCVNLVELHPYYETPDHPSMWDCMSARPLTPTLFYPDTGAEEPYTLPYRHRHQMNLWRLSQTMFTTNYLHPILDQLEADLTPAFNQLSALSGQAGPQFFTNQVAIVKKFIIDRRAWLYESAWSDKDTDIWDTNRTYAPSAVVMNEIMVDPPAGREYLELYNPSDETIDLSWWRLDAGAETYRLPHGTLLDPDTYLVIAGAQPELTNYFTELADPTEMVPRNVALPIWDHSIDFLTATEHRTRVVEIPALTLPPGGATLRLWDWESNVVSEVAYLSGPGWPNAAGASLERRTGLDPALATSWRRSLNVGTPVAPNTADDDLDGDGLPDSWEQQLVDHFAHLDTIWDVLPEGDDDGDDISHRDEYLLGLIPTVADAELAKLIIASSNDMVLVTYPTRDTTGSPYIGERRYSLYQDSELPPPNTWIAVEDHQHRLGDGQWQVFTNAAPEGRLFYRFRVEVMESREAP